MSAFTEAVNAAEKSYWDSMEATKTGAIRRVRCQHCHMVHDLRRMEKPESAFEIVEHHMRACALVHVTGQIRRALKPRV